VIHDHAPGIDVPVLAGLDLRELLSEVVESVEGVASLADRLQGLYQAVVSIGSELDLDQVLLTVAQTAAELVGAQYAALGVVDPVGEARLSQFVTVGMEADLVARIGHLPQGHGILGLLITDPHPLRLGHLSDHEASAGFPAHHPPMRSFLGVPIQVRGERFGNLYLTEKAGGEHFTETDEQIVLALAAAAGLAVQNARLYAESRRRQQWLEAASGITTQLLGGAALSTVLPQVTRLVRNLAGADLVLLALPEPDASLRVVASDGVEGSALRDLVIPQDAMAARVLRDGHSVAVSDAQSDPRVWKGLLAGLDVGPALYVPLGTDSTTMGTLVAARTSGRTAFDPEVVNVVESFAAQAAIALRLGAAAVDREHVAVLVDRDRIARDLHDQVIQQLFATGMTLDSAMRGMEPGIAARVSGCVDALDQTIKQIRTTIFALQSPAPISGEGVRAATLQAVHAAADSLGFEPSLAFQGPVDTLVPARVAEQMLAVVREALANIARHARASSATVVVSADSTGVELLVTDDGVGMTAGGRSSGLRNLASRAADLAGTFSATRVGEGGTQVRWTVPLP
jgi:signal transduction histidine kinase